MIKYTDLKYLTEDTQKAVWSLIQILDAKGLHPTLGETYRTPERQEQLFKKSLELVNEGKPPVTKTDHSWHETGRAVDLDIHPLDSGSGVTMDNVDFFISQAQALGFKTMVDPDVIAADEARGITYPKYWDWHHLEYRAGRNWDQARAEYQQLQKAPTDISPALNLAGVIGAFGTYSMLHNIVNGE